MTPIKSIKKELADCRAAFAAQPNAPFAWCIHHTLELEPITESIENRIQFILKNKAKGEQAIRFRNLRPARNLPVELVEAGKAYAKAYKAYLTAREACAKALVAYNKADVRRAKAYEAYRKAGETYDEADKAYAPVWKAYAKAYKAYKAQLSELHTRDWPDHTWNGNSIFKTK